MLEINGKYIFTKLITLVIYIIFLGEAFSSNAQLEANITAGFKNLSSIDNSKHLSGARLAIATFFYEGKIPIEYFKAKGPIEIGADASLFYITTNKRRHKPNFSKSITIFSPALLARWYPYNSLNKIKPFIEAGLGLSYLSNNDFEGRSLGIRFAFQDIAGVGLKTTNHNNLSLGVYIIHYSNASLHKRNRGITIPLSFRLGYRF